MEEHICALLPRFQCSEQFEETAAFRIVFRDEELSHVMVDWDIHNSYTLRNWVRLYRHKVQTGLFGSPAMTRTQKRDVQALRQANLLILAPHTMMEVAEQELQLPIRKKSGTKRSWNYRKTKSSG